MHVGCMRVSKANGSQSTDLQRDALLAAGVPAGDLYEDRASGKKNGRPHLAACLKALRHGDTLLVQKLDRLGRDHDHPDLGPGAAIDTTTDRAGRGLHDRRRTRQP
ncbi:recombinase family protein [Cryobacterium sp. TMT1-19]|nr:recombinase family protein [Cryobacterium sp. TMT1-19]